MKCNIVLEGGGAKGIAHIGALKAIEDYKIDVDSISGTSAGAIAAVLYASGYTSEQLYSPHNNRNNIDNILPESLLSIIFNKKIEIVKIVSLFVLLFLLYTSILCSYPYFTISLLITPIIGLIFLNYIKEINKFTNKQNSIFLFLKVIILLVIIVSTALLFIPSLLLVPIFFWKFGLLKTDGIREWLKDTLNNSYCMKEYNKGKKEKRCISTITVKEFNNLSKFNLKVIASSLSEKKMVIFSQDDPETKDHLIIDAIIASMAIPLVFKCDVITLNNKVHRFVDGGMLSNFPAWLHRKHLLLDEVKPTIGFKLSPIIKSTHILDNPISYFKNLIITAIWGNNNIENISVKGLTLIQLDNEKVNTLSLNISKYEQNELYCESYIKAIRHLERNYSIFHKNIATTWLKEISDLFTVIITAFNGVSLDSTINKENILNVRASLISIIDDSLNTSKIIHQYNMDNDLDRHLEFDANEGAAGVALNTSQPLVYLPKNDTHYCIDNLYINRKDKENLKLTINRRALVNPNIKTIFSIPIYNWNEILTEQAESVLKKDNVSAISNLKFIDFEIIKAKNIKPKAVLCIDYNALFLYDSAKDEERTSIIYRDPQFQLMLKIFSSIASQKIASVSSYWK
ncbi:patatin-like phospholipase family protein [Aliivibrio fischeri]|uniref:patatin-like phospholipase family protein n=1 Tax=Aliivibrio fischeri TaxID=668 RepID=UPI0007C536E8|nr:patatin-like phospholipase family protein [Aliivibrio fischeri]